MILSTDMASSHASGPSRGAAYSVLFCAVGVASTAAIMIRIAQASGMPSGVIAAGRLLTAAVLLGPFVFRELAGEIRVLGVSGTGRAVGAGVFLAAHFGFWIASLAHTSVASSVSLVATTPVWVALASWVLFREKLAAPVVIGILLAVLGSIAIGVSGMYAGGQGALAAGKHQTTLLGDSMAVAGAAAVAGYLMIARTVRRGAGRRVKLLPYVWLVYAAGGVVLLCVEILRGRSFTGYSGVAYFCILGLAVGPQLFSHTALNWAVRYISPTIVTLTILGEPVGSAVLAWLVFREGLVSVSFSLGGLDAVFPLQLAGLVLLLAGIGTAAISPPTAPEPPSR
jgi:drug/metabolite transporter (DMT)-like permease